MSKQKPKGKDSKVDPAVLMEQVEVQKRDILDYKFTVVKLEERLSYLTQENLRLRKEREETSESYGEKMEEMSIRNEANEKALSSLSRDKTALMIKNNEQQHEIKMLDKRIREEKQARSKELEEIKKNFHYDLSKYESQLTEYKLYMSERDELENDRADLREQVEIEKADRVREVADKEREKVQATDKLRREMYNKISDMEANLLSLKKEQLSTTTRLTMLQNHQLTSELEYQSKQTQKLIFQNQELQKKVISMKQEAQVHRQMEQELAKRSHFSKGVIKRLTSKINDLQKEIQDTKNNNCYSNSLKQTTQGQKQKRMEESNQSMVITLDQELQKSEKKHAELIIHHENLKKEREALEHRITLYEKSANQIYKLLYRCYGELLGIQEPLEDINKENHAQKFVLNLAELRGKAISDWSETDLRVTLEIIMNVIKPYLNRPNIMVPAVKKNLALIDESHSRSQKSRLPNLINDKLYSEREKNDESFNKDESSRKLSNIPINLASKIVGSNLREWGKTVNFKAGGISRRYKISDSYRI